MKRKYIKVIGWVNSTQATAIATDTQSVINPLNLFIGIPPAFSQGETLKAIFLLTRLKVVFSNTAILTTKVSKLATKEFVIQVALFC
jgi:hypothetical protein